MAHCFLLFITICVTMQCDAVVLTLKGSELISYDVSAENIATETLRIVLKLKTIDPSGLLIFSENTHIGDFISLELIDGKLRYKARLGFDDTSEQEVVTGDNLNDYHWHVVDIRLDRSNVTIEVDEKKIEKSFLSEFSRLDLNDKIFVGGVPDDVHVSHHQITSRKYSGCLSNFFFNDVDLLYKAKYSKPSFTTLGDLVWNACEELHYQPIMMKHPQDHALLPTYLKNSLSITFKFRTHIGEGLLFAKISKAVTVYVGLRKGVLLLNVEIRGQGPIVMSKGRNLNNGFWHRVEFIVSKEIIKLKVDKYPGTTHHNPWSHIIEFYPGNATLGGGEEQLMRGFVGCMYDIWVDDMPVNYQNLGKSYFVGVINSCTLVDKCLFSPCKNGGRCSQDHISYKCDCLNTMYSGKNCDESIYQKSCQDYKNIGLFDDSYCLVDPDGDGKIKPFRVLCNVTTAKTDAVTILQHNLKETEIPVSSGIVEHGSFHHTFNYGIPMETFDVLLEQAIHCRQYISFRCKNAFLLRSPRGPPDTVWTGRRGNHENYWGGALPDSGMCACRLDKSCALPYRYCNCDIGDDQWREDEGFFTQLDRLPVFGLSFKSSANQSFFKVGHLQCRFNSSVLQRNLSKERVLKACTPVNAKATIKPTHTNPRLNQKEKIINYNLNGGFEFGKPTVKIHIGKPHIPVNLNVTLELPNIKENDSHKKEDGLKFTLSVYAVIVIAVATVIVVIIIAVVVIVKRCQSRLRRHSNREEYASDDEYNSQKESTEMCTFFGAVSRSERNRPIIEVHRHSIHCDTLDELPPAYRDYGDYLQPITTHIDLSYKPRKKSLGIFC